MPCMSDSEWLDVCEISNHCDASKYCNVPRNTVTYLEAFALEFCHIGCCGRRLSSGYSHQISVIIIGTKTPIF